MKVGLPECRHQSRYYFNRARLENLVERLLNGRAEPVSHALGIALPSLNSAKWLVRKLSETSRPRTIRNHAITTTFPPKTATISQDLPNAPFPTQWANHFKRRINKTPGVGRPVFLLAEAYDVVCGEAIAGEHHQTCQSESAFPRHRMDSASSLLHSKV